MDILACIVVLGVVIYSDHRANTKHFRKLAQALKEKSHV